MDIMIFLIGLILGVINNTIINKMSLDISASENKSTNYFVIFISGLVFLIAYLKFGLDIIFAKAAVLAFILTIVAFIDLKHEIISDKIVIITLIIGIIFSFFGDISFISSLLGMLAGGGILFLLALIPGALGGGDIKLMFAVGAFLGLHRTLYALFLAFIFAACISIILLLLKIKKRKDHIPFGPFLALGSFFSFIFYR